MAARRGTLAFSGVAAAGVTIALAAACTGSEPDIDVREDAGSASDGASAVESSAAADVVVGPEDAGLDGAPVSKRTFPCNGQPCTGDDVVCCHAHDAGECIARDLCASPFARIECNDRADCPSGLFCCGTSYTEDQDASGPPYFLGSSCAAGPCAELTLCSRVDVDCPQGFGNCSGTSPDFTPTLSHCN